MYWQNKKARFWRFSKALKASGMTATVINAIPPFAVSWWVLALYAGQLMVRFIALAQSALLKCCRQPQKTLIQ
jgi:hypothetical protein